MPARLRIPRTLDDLTPRWLTGALREAGALGPAAEVVDVRSRRIGEGEGFIGDVVRLHLEVGGAAPECPRTLIAKLPTLRTNRGAGESLGVYEREILFYRELAPALPLRTPKHYYSAWDRVPGARYAEAIARAFDRLPRWLLWLLTRLSIRLARFSRRRYLLLLEDLGGARSEDQVVGCGREDAARALRALARLQAAWWQRPRLRELWWILPLDVTPRTIALYFDRSLPAFRARYSAILGKRGQRHLEWLEAHGEELLRALARRPYTLLHCDFRLDNLVFDEAGDIVVFDWQSPSRGPAAFDLAYFIGGSLRSGEQGAAAELRGLYHSALVEGGVCDYPREALESDYRLCLLAVLQRMALIGADLIDLGQDRGPELMSRWIERLIAELETIEPGGRP